MKKFTKAATLMLLSAVSVCGATSCGGGENRGPVAFHLWTGFGATYSNYIKKLIDYEWNTNQLNIEHTSQGSYEKLQKAINESAGPGTYPTIANGYPDHFAGYIRQDMLIPLNSYIDAYDAEHGTDLKKDYFEDYMKENMSLKYDAAGNPLIMGLPFNKSTELLGYNGYFVDYAKSKGVIEKVPETWQEWEEKGVPLRKLQLELCGKYLNGTVDEEGTATNFSVSDTKQENTILDMSKVQPTNSRLMSWDASDNMFITIVRQWGSTYTTYTKEDAAKVNPHGYIQFGNEAYTPEGSNEVINNKERTVAALEFFDGLFGDKSMDNPDYSTQIFGLPGNFGGLFSSDAFKANQVMFTVCSSGGLSYNTEGSQRFRVAPIPYYSDGTEAGTRKYVISQGTNLALFEQGDKDTLQKAFNTMVDFTTGKVQAQWSCDTGYFPASESATKDDAFKEMLNSKDYSDKEKLAYRESFDVNEKHYMKKDMKWVKFVDPGFVGSSLIRDEVGDILSSVFSNVGVKEGATYESIIDNTYSRLKDYVPSKK